VRPVAGVLAIAEAARELGFPAIVVPAENGSEASLVAGIEVLPIDGLTQLPALAGGGWAPERPAPLPLVAEPGGGPDLADLRGQRHLRHALEVAAAGGHSLLMVGPPGAGKSMAASRLPSILPAPGPEEALEVARIASACGRLGNGPPGSRPFRTPHHTISPAGLVGGGNPPRPGEATLAHRSVRLGHWPTVGRDRCGAGSPRQARRALAGDATGPGPVSCALPIDRPSRGVSARRRRPRICPPVAWLSARKVGHNEGAVAV
jgi:magnesium chelatase family protein